MVASGEFRRAVFGNGQNWFGFTSKILGQPPRLFALVNITSAVGSAHYRRYRGGPPNR